MGIKTSKRYLKDVRTKKEGGHLEGEMSFGAIPVTSGFLEASVEAATTPEEIEAIVDTRTFEDFQ